MKAQQLLIQKNNIVDIAIDYGDGYILHVNNNSGLISLYKAVGNQKEHVQTILLEDKEECAEVIPQE